MYSFSPDIQEHALFSYNQDKEIRFCKTRIRATEPMGPLTEIYSNILDFIKFWERRIYQGKFAYVYHRIARRATYCAVTPKDIFVEDENGIFTYSDVHKINKYAEKVDYVGKEFVKPGSTMFNEYFMTRSSFYEMMMPLSKKYVEHNKIKFT